MNQDRDGETISKKPHEHQEHYYKEGWTFYLILATITVTLGSSLPMGYNISVINTPGEVIKKFCNESFISRYDVHLDQQWLNVLWSFVVCIFVIGGCAGSIIGSRIANSLGRKMATLVTNFLLVGGGVLFLFCKRANSVEMLILGRLLVGLAGGLSTTIVPMYISELAPAKLSGLLGIYCVMNVGAGVLLGQIMGLDFLLGRPEDWPYLLSAYALLVLFTIPVLFLIPESPKYLFVIKRDEDRSLKELCQLRGTSKDMLINDLDILREEVRCSERTTVIGDNSWSMKRVLRDKRLRLPLLLVCAIQAGQQGSGINAVFYYSQTIFRQMGLTEKDAQYATIGCGVVNSIAMLLSLKLLSSFGRRPLLLASTATVTILLILLVGSMSFSELFWWMPYLSMIMVLLYVLAFSLGLGPITYFIGSELFEVGPRSAGMAWGSLCNWSGNFIAGMALPSMRDSIGPYSFLVFAGVTATLFVFQKVYLPETRGTSPTQISQLCSHGLQSRPLEKTDPQEFDHLSVSRP